MPSKPRHEEGEENYYLGWVDWPPTAAETLDQLNIKRSVNAPVLGRAPSQRRRRMTTKDDIQRLEQKGQDVRSRLAQFANSDPLEPFFIYLHQPGWTTLRELFLVERELEHLSTVLGHLEFVTETIVSASKQIADAAAS